MKGSCCDRLSGLWPSLASVTAFNRRFLEVMSRVFRKQRCSRVFAQPEGFGETVARATNDDPNGPQSWCSKCRFRAVPLPGWRCSEVFARRHLDTAVPFPPPPIRPEQLALLGDIELAAEGRKKLALHFVAERSRSNRIRFLHVRRLGGSLTCDGCDVDLAATLGPEYSEVVQLHHTQPLSLGHRQPRLEEFALLCPTCHAAVHFRRVDPLPIPELRRLAHRQR